MFFFNPGICSISNSTPRFFLILLCCYSRLKLRLFILIIRRRRHLVIPSAVTPFARPSSASPLSVCFNQYLVFMSTVLFLYNRYQCQSGRSLNLPAQLHVRQAFTIHGIFLFCSQSPLIATCPKNRGFKF